MELEEAKKYVEALLENYSVWYVHTGRDEDFLREIEKEAIEVVLNHLTK